VGRSAAAVQGQSDASDADLGVALFVLAIGALVSMRATGVLIDRMGPPLTAIAVAAFGLTAVLPGLAASTATIPPAPARLAAPARQPRAAAYWIENAWQSWTLDSAPAVSALGPALFAAAMAAGRVTVHRLAALGSACPC
jgi:hypothetical protein